MTSHVAIPRAVSRRRGLLAAVGLLLAVGLALGACSAKNAPTSATPTSPPTPTAPQTTATPSPTPTQATANGTAEDAVKAAIDKANREQQQAVTQRDATVMQDTATSAYYSELVQTQQALEKSGVTSIKLLSLDWGEVTVTASNAQASTTETWQVTFSNGSTQQSTDRNVYTLVQQGSAWLIASDVHVGSAAGQPGASGANQSRNWAGYAATGGPFTSVSAIWTVPHVTSTARGADATWVGLGGVTSNDLIQAGTTATVAGPDQVSYSAWLELLPGPVQTVPLTVSPGDVMAVSITQDSTGSWQVTFADKTTGRNYETTVQYSSSLSSVEWIEEAPATAATRVRIVPLDQFGQVQFQEANAKLAGKQVTAANAGAEPITMADQSGPIASPSALGPDGASFTVTRIGGGG